MLISIKTLCALIVVQAMFISVPANAADQDPVVAWEKIDKGVMLIDVRTAEEFAAGHIKGAINIPYDKIVPELTKQQLAKDTELVLYCRSGRRSSIAHDSLLKQGYRNSYNGGGYEVLASHH